MNGGGCVQTYSLSPTPGAPLRVGARPGIVTAPMVEGLEDMPGVRLSGDEFGALADGLEAGTLDCALLPMLMWARFPAGRVLPGMAVCARAGGSAGAIVTGGALEGLETVVYGPGAEPYAALAQILLAEEHGLAPRFTLEKGARLGDDEGSGLLVSPEEDFFHARRGRYRYDLNAGWERLTGLPLVMYLWVSRPRAPYGALRYRLNLACREGRGRLHEVAVTQAALWELEPEQVESFLMSQASYTAGLPELEGARAFLRLAGEHGLCAAGAAITLC